MFSPTYDRRFVPAGDIPIRLMIVRIVAPDFLGNASSAKLPTN